MRMASINTMNINAALALFRVLRGIYIRITMHSQIIKKNKSATSGIILDRSQMRINRKKLQEYVPFEIKPQHNITLPDELYYDIFKFINDRCTLINIARSNTMFCGIIYEILSGITVAESIQYKILNSNVVTTIHLLTSIVGFRKCHCNTCDYYKKFTPAGTHCAVCNTPNLKCNMKAIEFATCTLYVCTGYDWRSDCRYSSNLLNLLIMCHKCRTCNKSIYINDILGMPTNESPDDIFIEVFHQHNEIPLYGCNECCQAMIGYSYNDVDYGYKNSRFVASLYERARFISLLYFCYTYGNTYALNKLFWESKIIITNIAIHPLQHPKLAYCEYNITTSVPIAFPRRHYGGHKRLN
jgi:hypothetical protein